MSDKKEYNAKYYAEHKEEIREKQKKYDDEHKEELREKKRENSAKYYAEHKDEIKNNTRNLSETTKEQNRIRARNAYRLKHGIPLDADLCERGGAHHVKYLTDEQRRIARKEQQKIYNARVTPEQRQAHNAKYYAEHREEQKEYNAKYYAEHREKAKEYNAKYYAEKKQKEIGLTQKQIDRIERIRASRKTILLIEDDDELPVSLTISQITNDLDEYIKKYKISFNI